MSQKIVVIFNLNYNLNFFDMHSSYKFGFLTKFLIILVE